MMRLWPQVGLDVMALPGPLFMRLARRIPTYVQWLASDPPIPYGLAMARHLQDELGRGEVAEPTTRRGADQPREVSVAELQAAGIGEWVRA